MELWRLKNTDTRIVFPICDADGDPTSHADDNTPDSEWLSWNTADHAGAAPSFADCTHEFVEIANGIYYLDIQAAEINADFTLIQMKTALAGCKTQVILIRTYINSNEDLHGHLTTIDGHITADYGATEKSAIDLLDDASGGLADIHTDVGTVITNVGYVHATDLPAVKTVVDAIKAKTDNLPAAPADDTSIDSQLATIAGYIDTEIAAIKAKTDNLPASPASEGTLTTLHGHIDDILADTSEIQTELADGGRTDLLVDAIKAKTDNLPAAPADDTSIDSQLATIAGYIDTEIAAIKAKTDNLPASPASEGTLTTLHGHIDDILADTSEIQTELADGGRTDLLVDAIKAKTDALAFLDGKVEAIAEVSVAEAAIAGAIATTLGETLPGKIEESLTAIHGSGQWGPLMDGLTPKTYTVLDGDGCPVSGLECWATTDADGANLVDIPRITNDLGQVVFWFSLSAGTHVWIWHRYLTAGDEEVI